MQIEVIGKIHSIESFGTLDGPGIRTVVFFQGCPLKCKFCHNIDCTTLEGGTEYSVSQLVDLVIKNKEYWGKNGGVTCSGGEPTFQPKFLTEFLKELKSRNIHTAVDSCSLTSKFVIEKIAPFVDLWMLSIKHMQAQKHHELTGIFNDTILENILHVDKILSEQKIEKENNHLIRIRFLVIPTITDAADHILELAKFVKKIKNLEGVEVLGYGTHGKHKWIENFGAYPLEGIPDATTQDIQNVKEILKKEQIKLI